jgi:hypothetical protein
MRLLTPVRVLSLLALLLPAMAVQARAAATSPPPVVEVTYTHPDQFTETRITPISERYHAQDYLPRLKHYIQQRAARLLGPGQHLSIVITDLALAGNYEPWPGSPTGWMRVIRRSYPPRIDLHFTLRDAQGRLLKEGVRKLRNPGFMDSASIHDSDPLRYEKALVDRWLRKGVNGL